MILFVGPGRARHARARGVSGTRLPRRLRLDRQMGGRDRRTRRGMPEFVARAFRVAMQGRPGPVVIALARRHADRDGRSRRCAALSSPPRAGHPRRRCNSSARCWRPRRAPLAILGGSRWSEAALRLPSSALPSVPACRSTTSFRRSHLFPADHPNYVGDVGIGPNPSLSARIKSADLILLLGGRLSEMPSSSYTLLDIPTPRQKLVHVHPGAEELGRVYQPTLAIQASPVAFCAALDSASPQPKAWRRYGGTARQLYRLDGEGRSRSPARSNMARRWSGCANACRPTP